MEIVSETKSGLTAVEQQTEVSRKKGTIWETILKADQETLERLLHDNPKIINARGPVGECPIHMLFLFGSETHLNMARYLIKRFPQIIVQIYNKPVSVHISLYHLKSYYILRYRNIMEKLYFILLLSNEMRL
jgi:hypothetical protein